MYIILVMYNMTIPFYSLVSIHVPEGSKMKVRRKNKNDPALIQYTIRLEPQDYRLLRFLAKAVYRTTMSRVLREALRHYFAYELLTIYGPDFFELLQAVKKAREREEYE